MSNWFTDEDVAEAVRAAVNAGRDNKTLIECVVAALSAVNPFEWQPIDENTPRDGTRFIGWDGQRAFTAASHKHYSKYEELAGGARRGIETVDVFCEEEFDAFKPCKLVGWRPLPPQRRASK